MTESSNHQDPKSGFSRRAFLRSSGAVAAASALQAQTATAVEDKPAVSTGSKQIAVNVNGKDHSLTVETRTTLLEMLRYQLDLTGAKPVSMDGSSGASTVWINDKPAMASTTLAVTCDGKRVRTVESLGGDKTDPVPLAFVKHDAAQCGFCTPGFVVAVRAFLDKNPNATEAQIREGLNGNICRCGTYGNIVEAAMDVVKGGGNG